MCQPHRHMKVFKKSTIHRPIPFIRTAPPAMSAGWNTIESDAVGFPLFLSTSPNSDLQGVFTYLIDNLGVKDVQFEELISLDPAELQQLRYL